MISLVLVLRLSFENCSLHFLPSACAMKGNIQEKKSALPVLRSSVLVSLVGSVAKCPSPVEEEAFVELPATSVATVVDTGIIR